MSEPETAGEMLARLRHEYPGRHHFEHALRRFVEVWAPEDPHDRDEFQRHLMLLFTAAMQSQTETMSKGVDHYASQQIRAMSLAPLAVILEKPTKGI